MKKKNITSKEDAVKEYQMAKMTAPSYNIICPKNDYSPSQKLVSDFLEFFLMETKVIWSMNESGCRRVHCFYTDTNEEGAFLQGSYPEKNWDQIASQFFEVELNTLLKNLAYDDMAKESQLYLNNVLQSAQKILKHDKMDFKKFEI